MLEMGVAIESPEQGEGSKALRDWTQASAKSMVGAEVVPMHVFIAWSGARSNRVATELRRFISVVVQRSTAWMSESDLAPGTPWDEEIESRLRQSQFGVVCLTRDNLTNPWLNYEAGAIANQVGDQQRLCPVLIDGLIPSEVPHPLARFQSIPLSEAGAWKLVQSINAVTEFPLETTALKDAFDGQWGRCEQQIGTPDATLPPMVRKRRPDDVLDEILETVRQLSRRDGPPPIPDSPYLFPNGLFPEELSIGQLLLERAQDDEERIVIRMACDFSLPDSLITPGKNSWEEGARLSRIARERFGDVYEFLSKRADLRPRLPFRRSPDASQVRAQVATEVNKVLLELWSARPLSERQREP